MKALTRWDPFRELEELDDRMGSMFRQPIGRRESGDREAMTMANWAPLVDITEDEHEFLIKAELPEVKKEEVNVSVENGILSIKGERKAEKEEKGKKYHRVERSYGSFVRSFSLPEGTEADKVTAEFKEGMLKVHLPKSKKVQPTAVEIKES